MADLSALLIDAAAKGRRAREEALAVLAQPAPEPTAAEVDAVLATLPEKVAEVMHFSPAAQYINPMGELRNRKDRALAAAVAAELHKVGIETRWNTAPSDGPTDTPIDLLVSVPSLLAAGDRAAESRALLAFAEAWQALTDGAGSSLSNHDAGTLIATHPTGSHTIAPGWQARPTAELVEEARKALRLPLWRAEDVRAGWEYAVETGSAYEAESAHVVPMPGYYVGSVYRPVPCLVFTAGEGVTVALDMADILDMTAADVVSLAVSRAGFTAPASERVPAQPSLPAIGAQPERHLSRKERREQHRAMQRHA